MTESVYTWAATEGRAIEKVLFDENLHYIHMVFPRGEGLPVHLSNSNVYMTVLRGRLTIALNDEQARAYGAGTLLKIPFQTRMDVKNTDAETLELLVVKAPAPKA